MAATSHHDLPLLLPGMRPLKGNLDVLSIVAHLPVPEIRAQRTSPACDEQQSKTIDRWCKQRKRRKLHYKASFKADTLIQCNTSETFVEPGERERLTSSSFQWDISGQDRPAFRWSHETKHHSALVLKLSTAKQLERSKGCQHRFADLEGRLSIDDSESAISTSSAEQDSKHPLQESPWRHLVAGAAAGAVSRTLVAPLETLRLQAITGTASHKNLLKAARSIVRDRGWQALYRGNFLNVIRAAPQKALDFFAFEIYKGWLGARSSQSLYPIFTAAALAGATSSLTLHPLEVLRSRLTCDNSGQYQGLVSATRQIVQSEGVRALYQGLGPSLVAIVPEAVVTYGMFDVLKRMYASQTHQEKIGMVPRIACGVVSSFTGQMLAFPIEALSRRLQIEQAAVARLGTIAFLSNLVEKQGPLALYRGLGAAILKTLPMSIFSFSTYEIVCLLLARSKNARATDRDRKLQ